MFNITFSDKFMVIITNNIVRVTIDSQLLHIINILYNNISESFFRMTISNLHFGGGSNHLNYFRHYRLSFMITVEQ